MANLRTISQFKSQLAGGGARSNLFEVRLATIPFSITWPAENFSFMCKSAALPASNIAQIDVPFRGRILKVAGDRTIDVWTVTVINDESFQLRSAFELWMNEISQLSNNSGATNPGSYMVDAEVYQLGRGAELGKNNPAGNNNGSAAGSTGVVPLKSYKFYDIFPTSVSAIDVSYDSSDTIEDFTVEFQVQYWTAGETQDQTGIVMV